MQINRNAWHYRWLRLFRSEYEIPTNLCPYVRHLLGFTTLAVLVALIGIFLAMAMLLSGGSALWGHEWMLNYIGVDPATANEDGNDWWVAIYIFGIVGWLITSGFLVYGVLTFLEDHTTIPDKVAKWNRERKKAKAEQPVDTSSIWYLLKRWLEAIHDKACPQISWEGDDGWSNIHNVQRSRKRAVVVAAIAVVALAVWILV